MSDVLQSAVEYQRKLKSEIIRIEDFLSLAENLMNESGSETPLPTIDPKARTATPTATAQAASPEQPAEEPSRLSIVEDEAPQPEAIPAPKKNGSASLFRGAFGPFDSERNKSAASAAN